MTLLKDLREQRNRAPEELATIAGINLPSYYDLEDRQDELEYGVDVGVVARLAKELAIKPSAFYGGESKDAVSIDDLAARVRDHLARTGDSLADFEEQVGWEVADALANPAQFSGYPADALRDICNGIGVNWFDVLDHLEDK